MVRAVAMSFGMAIDVDAPFPELMERARAAEVLGFHTVYVPDHSRPWRHEPAPGGIWFDGWTVLSAFAAVTSRVRIGTLVTNPVLRPPGLVVRQALAVDHLSTGRLQLGIGTGIAGFDHEATGTPYWPLGERLARFREYVDFVDGALRSGGSPFTATGRFFSGRLTGLPEPVQRPRPPMTLAGASKGVRAAAVERAEGWNTHGAFGVAPGDLVDHLGALNADVTRRCEESGRDPRGLTRSVLLLASLSPWSRPGRLVQLAEMTSPLGFDEIVVFWPWDDAERAVFERDVGEVATLAS